MNHRRPNPDELTPEDLFRPEPSAAAASSADEAATQYLPPYPASAPQMPAPGADAEGTRQLPALPEEAPQQQPFFGFGQQPQPAPQPPAYPQPQQPPAAYARQPQYGQPGPYGQQPPGYGPQPGYGQAADPGYGDERDGGRRFSNRAIAIAVVAACAVVGIVAGAVLSGGSGGSASAATSPSASATATGQAGGAGDAKSQASALYALIGTAADSRSEAIQAVADITGCRDLDSAVSALKDSAGKHAELVAKLSGLQVDKLSNGQALDQALRASWQQSQSADAHYAAWGAESRSVCGKKHHPLKKSAALTAADLASYHATADKQQAAQLWNAVATAYGLPQRSAAQL